VTDWLIISHQSIHVSPCCQVVGDARPAGRLRLSPAGGVRAFSPHGLPASRVVRTCVQRPHLLTEEGRVRAASTAQRECDSLSKPKGGYQLIPAVRLALAWWAYREKLIRLVDLRVWFAACEMVARRCASPAPLPRRFGIDELRQLTGLSAKRLRESLRRLGAARLLGWSESAITFPASPEIVPLRDRNGFEQFLGRIPNHRRLVPVPRRILRLLAGGARPALIATILGHLIRCLYLKGGQCLDRGRVKASWIADTFGISLRRVKQARQELIAIGWLIPLKAGQWELNRWGSHVRINLTWSRLDGIRPAPADAAPELAPPPPASGPELAPPDSDEEPLQGNKNQEPASGPAGFLIPHPEEQTPAPLPVSGTPAAIATGEIPPPRSTVERPASPARPADADPGKPDLHNVVPEDLKDTGRLLKLYDQAVAEGLVTRSEWDRLRFVAAAEHARIIGTRNPCGLFVRLVRGGLLHFATQDDETAASARIRRHLYGCVQSELRAEQGMDFRRGHKLSEDARLVQAVHAVAARAGYRGDAFPLLKRQKPEWTRERWDLAVAELNRGLGSGMRDAPSASR
jgi:hypothetical protein